MTTKSSKLSKDNGWGGVLTDLEWDIYYGNPERLAKISAYPVWNTPASPSYAWSWMLVRPGPNGPWTGNCTNDLDQLSGRYHWWERTGKPACFWVNIFFQVSFPNRAEQEIVYNKTRLASEARRAILDKKAERQNELRLKKLGLTAEQEKLLKEHKHNERRYYNLEVRRPNYLLGIQRELALLQQGSKFLEMPDEEFLENFPSISNETRRALMNASSGDLLGWLDTRRNILKFRKENEAAIKVIEESQARTLADSPKSK